MSYVPTLSILSALKAGLQYIPHPTLAGEKLFERVEYHDNKRLREALTDLVIIKQRVALIVPGGDSYQTTKEGRTYRSVRTSTFDLLLADRAWTKGGHEASFGGPQNVGVLTMKELVVQHFIRHPQLGLPHVVLQPEEGAHIDVVDDQVKDSPGRECFVISYSTPAGEEIINPTAPWPTAN